MKYLLIAVTLLSGAIFKDAQSSSEWDKLLNEVKYTLSEAIDKGLKEAGEGTVFHAELELDKGKLVYSIDVAQGNKTCNVVLDVKEGKVVEKKTEDEDYSDKIKASKITLKAAVETALKKIPGKTIEAQLVIKDGKPVIVVKVFDGKVTSSAPQRGAAS